MALAGAVFGRSGPDFRALVERAEGNPLFLVQLVRHADESLTSALPSSIQSLVLARADRLAPDQKRLLQTAAVLGQRFALEAVRHLAERPTAELDSLVVHGLMVTAGPDVAFAHALVHEAIYASLPRAPPFDPSGNTALVGATFMFEIMCILADAVARRKSRAGEGRR